MLPLLALFLVGLSAPCGDGVVGPEETVRRYLSALQAGDFQTAYPLVTAAMTQDKSREQWIREQQWATQTGDVAILTFQVLPATVADDRATVPVRVRSRDAVAGADVDEHELYTLLRDADGWRISQQQVVDAAAQPTPPADPPATPAAP